MALGVECDPSHAPNAGKIMTYLCIILFIYSFPFPANAAVISPVNSTVACGSSQPLLVDEKYGFITSPNFDNFHFYPPNSNCSWTLEAPKGQVLFLKTMYFGMNTDCRADGLEIYDGVQPNVEKVGVFCGYFAPLTFRSKTNVLLLRFYSGPKPVYTGFQLFFQHSFPIVTCGDDQVKCRHLTACVSHGQVCDGIDDCKDGSDEENCDKMLVEVPCGVPKIPPVLGNERIVGGRDAIPGSWPWQVSFRQIDMIPYSHMCGGVLISRKWLVTAAHCFRNKMNKNLWNVFLGKHFKLIADEEEQLRYIRNIYIHPDYKGFDAKFSDPWIVRKQHDIALVELNAPVTVTDFVSPVCLPAATLRVPPGDICHVTGWGETYRSGFELVLKQAAVPIVSTETCRKMHFLYTIAETMICAGYATGGHDSCQGDSGGPLVYSTDKETWTLAGIVSTGGSICADKDQPGIYTYVPYYMNWIENITQLVFQKY